MNNYRFSVDRSGEHRAKFSEILKDEKKEYSGYSPTVTPKLRPEQEPEFGSLSAFISYMKDEADENGLIPPYTVEQTEKLSFRLRMSLEDINLALRAKGLLPAKREPARPPRGYRTTENKWAQNPSYGCSGQVEITGFASSSSHSHRAPELGMKHHPVTRALQIKPPQEKPQGLAPVNPEKDLARLHLIREQNVTRSATEKLRAEEIAKQEQAVRKIQRQERLLLRMMAEAEIIQKWGGTKQERIDKCIRFTNMVKLYKECFGEDSTTPIQEEVVSVREIFQSLM